MGISKIVLGAKMVLNRIKQKILNSSDSYNFYKQEYDNKIKQHNQILDSYNKLFNSLYLNFELTPTPFLRNIRELGYQSMIFLDNVCKKHDLSWWLDGGTLLGAVRHGDYIPWDDDLDTAMMRKDYNVLCDVIDEEIVNNNLTNVYATFKEETYRKEPVHRWIQVHYLHPDYNEKKYSFVGLDIFPFDYLKDYHGQNIEDQYQKSRARFYRENREGVDLDTVLKNYYNDLNLNMEREDYYISGVEGTRGPVNTYDLVMMQTDKLFPLKRINFGENKFPVPNDYKDYVIAQYGEKYLQIPKVIRDHGRLTRIREIDNIVEYLEEAVAIFKNANENFK